MTKSELLAQAEALEWAAQTFRDRESIILGFHAINERADELRAQAAACEASIPIVDGSKPYYVETDGVRRKYLPTGESACEAPEPVAWRILTQRAGRYSYVERDLAPTYKCEPLYFAPPDQSARITELKGLLRECASGYKWTRDNGYQATLLERIRAALEKKP
jgi:hypothetical protein